MLDHDEALLKLHLYVSNMEITQHTVHMCV